MSSPSSFPPNFTWGAATAAAQIEGAASLDGKGDSVWDVFAREPNRIFGNHTPSTACDFYHRWPEDIAMMRTAGLPAFRLSISWPRVIPSGAGPVNPPGLAFYDRLIDGLLEANIRPYVTLFHWDLPQAIQARGGWMNRDIADWFAEYTDKVTAKLGDRVQDWITFNEPQIFLAFGHRSGTHAPGLKLSEEEVFRCAHHVNLAHGKAVEIIRGNVPGARIGMAQVANVGIPADPADPLSVEAARRLTLDPEWTGDAFTFLGSCWWSRPTLHGDYPPELFERHPGLAGIVRGGDMDDISRPLDFYGFNYYFGRKIAADGSVVPALPGEPRTAFGWPVHPEGLYWASRFYHEAHGLPLYIFENGLSSMDWVNLDGAVHDTMRIDFLTRYLRELRRAIEDGADVRGWFHWSWMDNFEWADGYKERFGLVHVDYENQRRTPKDSLAWFAGVIRTNGASVGCRDSAHHHEISAG